MVLCKPWDQYLTTVQVSKESIHGLRRYKSLNDFNQNIFPDTNADTDARVTTIALHNLSFRLDNKFFQNHFEKWRKKAKVFNSF